MEHGDEVPALVSTTWLAAHLRSAHVRIIDARWYHDGRKGVDAYRAGHVPGAIHLDVDGDLSAPASPQLPGRHPLPSPAAFADVLARAGVGPSTRVIAYDDDGGSRAARLWWMLRYYGHGLGGVLDGGIAKWQAEGHPLDVGAARAARAQPMELVALPRHVVDKSRLAEMLNDENTLVLDARAPERYSGAVEPLDRRAGHIPGAVNAPYARNLTPAGIFRSKDDLFAYFTKLGASKSKRVVVYCGSGVTACHTLLALHLAGFRDTYLYEGSWSDWSSDPSLPVATGSEP
jgi:thiosulfate/3-mercaptopyruvate sulfurtransferase